MAGRKKKLYRKTDILEAIKGSGGIVTTVALALNCDWHTAKANIDRYEEAREAFSGELETGLDLVEGKAYAQAKNGDSAMIRFILATKGRNRGYGETPPITAETAEDTELTINIIDGTQNED